MANFNRVQLLGRLTGDPEDKTKFGGKSLAVFSVATNHKYRDGEELKEVPCFVEIACFGSQADSCLKALRKGSQVFLEGYLKYSEFTQDGKKRKKLSVVANTVQFLEKSKPKDDWPL